MQEPLDIYSKIQFLVKKEINDSIQAFSDKAKFSVSQIPAHSHTGVDSQQIDFSDLLGLPIWNVVPTDFPIDGTIRLYDDGITRKIYAFIGGIWYSTVLT